MKFVSVISVMLLSFSALASAEEMEKASSTEFGILFGLSHFRDGNESATLFGLPTAVGANLSGNSYLYLYFFPHERFSIGPEFSVGRISIPEGNITSAYLGGRAAYHPFGNKTGTYSFLGGVIRYLSAGVGASGTTFSVSETNYGLGTGAGYRWCMDTGFIVRTEVGYQRVFDASNTTVISLLIGFGFSF